MIFPGIGYKIEKPLLYYSCKIVESLGYIPFVINYEEMPRITPSYENDTMEQCISIGFWCAERMIREIKPMPEDDIIIIGKSIGTAIGARVVDTCINKARCVWYTPIKETFACRKKIDGIVFHGTNDPWMDNETLRKLCRELNLPLYETKDANHSLETGDVFKDIKEIGKIMNTVSGYLKMDR